jgi:hypothetical protein
MLAHFDTGLKHFLDEKNSAVESGAGVLYIPGDEQVFRI